MNNYEAIAASLISRDAFLARCNEPGVFGAKKQAARAEQMWLSAEQRAVLAHQAVRAPGGTGTGLLVHLIWDENAGTADVTAAIAAVADDLPAALTRADEKATYRRRDKKQGVFFMWQDVRSQELSQWFFTRFGVHAFASQLFSADDLNEDLAIVAIIDGVDHIWLATSK
ncbi:hypothetical protein [Leucobacter japonicus]|uniref:hypothetical protein n=1 Tax=Leucobacter japonicus TaxID=1461259 RepID=UPI0006A77E3F|nr:hypothetical protein [Leucobacter japonicus]